MATDDDKRDIARRFLEATARGEFETVRSLAADDFNYGWSVVSPLRMLNAFSTQDTDYYSDITEVPPHEWDQLAPVLAEHFTPTYVDTIDGYIEWERHSQEMVEPVEFALEYVSVQPNDRVVSLGARTGTHVGTWRGHAPTGETIETIDLWVLQIENEVVSTAHGCYEREHFYQQMGIYRDDLTAVKIDQQFDTVVNRVLRHNLRTDLSIVDAHLDQLTTDVRDSETHAKEISAATDRVLDRVEKIRTVEQRVLAPTESHQVTLGSLVRSVVEQHQPAAAGGDLSVTVGDVPTPMGSDEGLVELAVEEAVENAIEYAGNDGGSIKVSVGPAESDEYAATITVADTGPGIPATELEPLTEGRETQLDHASGIGLWAIKWSVERLGGEVEFADNDPQGSIVRLHLPDMD